MQLIKGREIADNILNSLRKEISKAERKPTLAVVLIGDDEASRIYVELKRKAAESIGMNFMLFNYVCNIDEGIILKKIKELNNDEGVDGIIVQLPLPEGLDRGKIINSIDFQKDVDGFHCENQKKFCCGDECRIFPVFPKAIVKIIESAIVMNNLESYKKAVIICMSEDFGLIMQEALRRIRVSGEYFFCDRLPDNLEKIKSADIIITACGKSNLLNSPMVKEGAIIVDGGIIKDNGKVKGDVDIQSFKNSKAFISPVPGGVGPVTVACLLENTFLAGKK